MGKYKEDEDVLSFEKIAQLIGNDTYFARDEGDRFYVFENGIYRSSGKHYIRRRVKEIMVERNKVDAWDSQTAEDLIKWFAADARLLKKEPPGLQVNLLNGILDLNSRILSPHDPDFLWPIQLPIAYDPKADCPCWNYFINSWFPEDAIRIAYQIPAALLIPGHYNQKSVILVGPGGNGKSRYIAGMKSFAGADNTVTASLQRLEGDKFATARLYGKLLAICSDMPSTTLTNTTVFKLLTGGDILPGERKFCDAFNFRYFGMLLFALNNVPKIYDNTDAFWERWRVLHFGQKFRDTNDEIAASEIDSMLSDPSELSGLLNRALNELPIVLNSGIDQTETMKEALESFKSDADPITRWIEQSLEAAPEVWIPKRSVIDSYNAYADKSQMPRGSNTAIGSAIKRYFPNLKEGSRRFAGKVQDSYCGIQIKQQAKRSWF
jgi:P4 family phage/plasmid primase-like protien